MTVCPHSRQIGDNAGQTCLDCGERLAGYGYRASRRSCLHSWLPFGDESGGEICPYCEKIRDCQEIEGVQ